MSFGGGSLGVLSCYLFWLDPVSPLFHWLPPWSGLWVTFAGGYVGDWMFQWSRLRGAHKLHWFPLLALHRFVQNWCSKKFLAHRFRLYAGGEFLLEKKSLKGNNGALFSFLNDNKMLMITFACLLNFLSVGCSLLDILCMVIQALCLVNNHLAYRKSLQKLLCWVKMFLPPGWRW